MEIGGKIRTRKEVLGWLIGLVVFIILAVLVSFKAAVVFALFSVVLLLRIDSIVPMMAALALLLICPILLAFEQKFAAETLASWAYCFLAIAIVLRFINYAKSNAGKSSNTG